MKKLILIVFLLFPLVAQAAPNVTNVSSSTVANGQSIVVTGTDFGPNGPNVVIFDDFEGGTNGSQLQLNLAEIGAWTEAANPGMTMYSNLNRISGNLSARMNFDYKQLGVQ